jgi:hypothetical protein
MRSRLFLIATAGVVACSAGWSPSAVAAPGDRICVVDENDQLVCMTEGDAPAGPTTPGSDVNSHEATPATYWSVTLLAEPSGAGDANGPCTDANGEPGRTYLYILRDAATGVVMDRFTRCVALGAPEPPVEEAPPAPPTQEELLDAAPIPQPAITMSPAGRGLTGLESWFWTSTPATVEASATVRGWTVTGSLTATAWVWHTGDGATYTSNAPGTAEQPAARHVYETKATQALELDVTWTGSYAVSGFGTTFTVGDLTTTGTATADYPVVEVRGVLDEPGAGE